MPFIKLNAHNFRELNCLEKGQPASIGKKRQFLDSKVDYELYLTQDSTFWTQPDRLIATLKNISKQVNTMALIFEGFRFPFDKLAGANITHVVLMYPSVLPRTDFNRAHPSFVFSNLPNLKSLQINGPLTMKGLKLLIKNLQKDKKGKLEELIVETSALYRFYDHPRLVSKKREKAKDNCREYQYRVPDTISLCEMLSDLIRTKDTLIEVTVQNPSLQNLLAENQLVAVEARKLQKCLNANTQAKARCIEELERAERLKAEITARVKVKLAAQAKQKKIENSPADKQEAKEEAELMTKVPRFSLGAGGLQCLILSRSLSAPLLDTPDPLNLSFPLKQKFMRSSSAPCSLTIDDGKQTKHRLSL